MGPAEGVIGSVWENIRHAVPDTGEQELSLLLGAFMFELARILFAASDGSGGRTRPLCSTSRPTEFFDARDAVQITCEMVRAVLVAAKPGPRAGHKPTGEILAWAEQQVAGDPALKRPSWSSRSSSGRTRSSRTPPCTNVLARSRSGSACWSARASPPGGVPRPG
ncbi:hypothetical protein [Rhodococcus koreensis]